MTAFKRERLNRYIADANQWLTTVQSMLQYPETPAQASAASMTRAAKILYRLQGKQLNKSPKQHQYRE